MAFNTPDQQITYPAGADLANNPSAFLDMLADAEQRLVRQYTDVADRLARMLALAENQVSSLSTENRLDVYDGTNHVSLAARSHNNMLRRTADAAAINNSTVLVPDAVLTAPIVPTGSSTYMFKAFVLYDATTVADVKFAFTVPAFTAFRWAGTGLSPAATSNIGDVKMASISGSGTSNEWGGAGLGVIVPWMAEGYLTGVTAGNIVLSYAQQNLEATNLTIRTGSYLRVTRVV